MYGWHSTQTKKALNSAAACLPSLLLPNSSCTMSFLPLALTTCMKNPVRSSPVSSCYSCFPQCRSTTPGAGSARCAARAPHTHPEPAPGTAPPILTRALHHHACLSLDTGQGVKPSPERGAAQSSTAWTPSHGAAEELRAQGLCDSWEQQHTLDGNQTEIRETPTAKPGIQSNFGWFFKL